MTVLAELVPSDGPKPPKGCYEDGSPGPQLRKRMARDGWTWIGELVRGRR